MTMWFFFVMLLLPDQWLSEAHGFPTKLACDATRAVASVQAQMPEEDMTKRQEPYVWISPCLRQPSPAEKPETKAPTRTET